MHCGWRKNNCIFQPQQLAPDIDNYYNQNIKGNFSNLEDIITAAKELLREQKKITEKEWNYFKENFDKNVIKENINPSELQIETIFYEKKRKSFLMINLFYTTKKKKKILIEKVEIE